MSPSGAEWEGLRNADKCDLLNRNDVPEVTFCSWPKANVSDALL